VENVSAKGPSTVASNPEKSQNVNGRGIWDGKKWRVVFVRKMKPESSQEVKFKKDSIIPVGFAVWNGSENDRNGQKMVSTW
jgi:DMSO reductase family type II enzyme heme b subunit